MSNKSGGLNQNGIETITISVLGISGTEDVKGSVGVGKSLLCNRIVRGEFDGFCTEHSSILSQSDFIGSPVINNSHWLYWGEALINSDELHTSVQVRVIEQTEFIDDEKFKSCDDVEDYAKSATVEDYAKRATKVKLESANKLMYICRDQLGLEAEFEQRTLPERHTTVDGFIFVYDLSFLEDRPFEKQSDYAFAILTHAVKTKRPVVVAASKADIADENGRKALQRLLTRKEFRSANIQIIEVSSVANVNVINVFAYATALIGKWKVKPRLVPFAEAARIQKMKEQTICDSYVLLLRKLMPIDCWPNSRPTWYKLLNRFGLAMHSDYAKFVYVFGIKKAKEYYKIHVEEAKNYWIQRRLQSHILRLPKLFEVFIGFERLTFLTWPETKKFIFDHPLFDKFFLPVGTLTADLDPSATKVQLVSDETRIPAEVLLAPEAETIFSEIQRVQAQRYRQAHLEEEFENTLATCSQVTPGKPMEEVDIFLREKPSYDALPFQLAQNVYAKYQERLIEEAETDFQELLLENVQLFIGLLGKQRRKKDVVNAPLVLSDADLREVKTVLSDDLRYRQLNCLHEERDEMLSKFASFVFDPTVQDCFLGPKCIECLLHDDFHAFLERRQTSDANLIFEMQVILYGENRLKGDFQSGAGKVLCGDIFESEKGLARIHFVNETESSFDVAMSATWIYLVDSMDSCSQLRAKCHELLDMRCPPVIVLVADAVHFDLLPVLKKECSAFARDCGGKFVPPGTDCDEPRDYSHASENELNAYFTRDQMVRTLNAIFSSQISPRRLDARVRISAMCGDHLPLESFFDCVLANTVRLVPYSAGGAAILDLSLQSGEQYARIEICFSSYHALFSSSRRPSFHGNIMLYWAQRQASFAHLETVLRNFVHFSHNVAFMIVAVVESSQDLDEGITALLAKGKDLADMMSASFTVFTINHVDEIKEDEFTEFFEKVVRLESENSLTSAYNGSFQMCYGSTDNLDYSKQCDQSYGMDLTLTTGWSSGSRESTSSSRKSVPVASDASLTPLITRGHHSTHPFLHSQRSGHSTLESSSAEDSRLLSEADKKFVHLIHVPRLNVSSARDNAFNDGKAPLATPEAAENFSDFGSFKAEPSVSRQDVDRPSLKFANLVTVNAARSCSASSVREYAKVGNRERHARKAFVGGVSMELPLNRLKSRLQSVSAESLITVGVNDGNAFYDQGNDSEASSGADLVKKSTTSRFVRKVASSFRFRKNLPSNMPKKVCDVDYDTTFLSTKLPVNGSCSAPHSPNTDRAAHSSLKTKDVTTVEKNSNLFSWFPSRSPRRAITKGTSESVCRTGIVMPSDTLESLASVSKNQVPIFVKMCIEYIEKEGGLEVEGIYRIPGNQAQVGELENAFVSNSMTAFQTAQPPVNAAATALKNFFASLPEPLVPYEMCDQLVSCLDSDQSEALLDVGVKLREWPVANQKTFAYLGAHLARVAQHSDTNAMDIRNLAKVWWPTLFRPNFDSFESMAIFIARLELAAQLLLTYAGEHLN